LKQVQAVGWIADPKPPSFTPEEMSVIQAFAARQSYADFNRFSEALLNQLDNNESNNRKVEEIRRRCY
jgi:hypothetical protein